MIQVDEMRAAEQALAYVVPSVRGMLLIVSLTAKGYCPAAAGVPCATAAAGVTPSAPTISAVRIATARTTVLRRAAMWTPELQPLGAAHAKYTRNPGASSLTGADRGATQDAV